MSWKVEFSTDATGAWYGNAVRFATKEEADANALAKAMVWTAVRDFRSVASDDPVNYRWVDGRLTAIEEESQHEQA